MSIEINPCDLPSLKDISLIYHEQTDLNIAPLHNLDIHLATATFGMGCFWGAESLYGGTKGVLRTTVGYSGGNSDKPTYRNLGDHTEVVKIGYDPKVISFKELLNIFWNNHEYGLSTPIKRQYMSLILYHNENQKQIAEQSKLEEQDRRSSEVITTEIAPAKKFWPAEEYHQKYRLQGHKDLCTTLRLDTELFQNSYVATKLNGFLVGVGGLDNFKTEIDGLGLTPTQKQYCWYYAEKNEGMGLYC